MRVSADSTGCGRVEAIAAIGRRRSADLRVGQAMKMCRTLLAAAAVIGLAACGSSAVADRDAPVPNLSETVETRGDWSLLNVLVDRPPAESELLMQSPITVDLNAMLGPRVFDYRKRMVAAGPLVRNGTMLVSVTPPGPNAAYLVIEPSDNVLEAGWRRSGRWHVERTAGTTMRRPRQVEALFVR